MNNLEIGQDVESSSSSPLKFAPEDLSDDMPISFPMRKVLSRTEQLEELLLSLHDPEAHARSTVSRGSSESNQRQFARCPIPEEQTSAVLSANGRSYHCQLVELSIGGFGVLIPGSPKLYPGIEGRLRAPGLNYIVGVTRQEARPGGTFVGLRQIEELLGTNPYQPNANPSFVGYLLAGIAGAMVATLMYYFQIGG